MYLDEIFSPLWRTSAIFGMTSVFIHNKKVVCSKIKLLYSVAYVTVCVIGMLIFFTQMTTSMQPELSKLKSIRLLIALHSIGIFLLMVFIILFVIIKWSRLIDEIRKIRVVDLELYRLDQRDNVVRSNQKIRRLTIATLVLVQVGFNVLGILYSSGTKHDKQIIYFLIMSLPRLVYSNMIIIFCVIVQVLHSRFRIVNLIQSKLKPKSDDFCSTVDHILSLHKILVRISRTVNSIFSIQLLLWIAGDFILIVGDLYAAMVIVFVRTLSTHLHVFLGLMKNCLLLGLELFYLSKVCRDLCLEVSSNE